MLDLQCSSLRPWLRPGSASTGCMCILGFKMLVSSGRSACSRVFSSGACFCVAAPQPWSLCCRSTFLCYSSLSVLAALVCSVVHPISIKGRWRVSRWLHE
jgi:hypothetical protein